MQNNKHPFMKALDEFEKTLYDKMSKKLVCDCDNSYVQIVTGDYEYCGNCGGVITEFKTLTM